jgi:hypothetical protein
MSHQESKNHSTRTLLWSLLLLMGCFSLAGIGGCGGATTATSPNPSQQGPETYFAPYIAGTTNAIAGSSVPSALLGPETYAVDDSGDAFSQSTYQLNPPTQQGPQVINAGNTAAGQRDLLDLGITVNYRANSSTGTFDPP